MNTRRGIIRCSKLRKRSSYLRLLKQTRAGEVQRLKAGVYARPEALADVVLDIPSIIEVGSVHVQCVGVSSSHRAGATSSLRSRKKGAKGSVAGIPAYKVVLGE